MNRLPRILLALTLVGVTAACASATDDSAPSASPTAPATAEPTASISATPMPTPSTSQPPEPSHDMGDMGGSGETVTVDIANFDFVPTETTITAGTEVIFTNSDTAPHTATAGTDAEPMPDVFDSGLLQPGETFSFVFDQPGEYDYFCERHPPMVGTIVVEG